MEIIVPLNDEYTLSLGTETWEMNRDQIALIAPRTLHSIVQTTNKPNLILQFSNIFLPQLHDFAANKQRSRKPMIRNLWPYRNFSGNVI